MATQQVPTVLNYKAAAEMASSQHRFVKVTAAGVVGPCTAITDKAPGVLQNRPAFAGDGAGVAIDGVVLVEAAAGVALDAYVGPSLNGRAQTAVATQIPRGIAKTACSNAGEFIEVLLIDTAAAIPE